MKRRYSIALFEQRIKKIRELLPDAFIGVDLIAGMNGETPELFEKAFKFVENLDISELHVFPYSERKNTLALKIEGIVPVEERRQRAQKLIGLSEKKLRQFYLRNIGKTSTVLFENEKQKGIMQGWTANYLKVETPVDTKLLNQFRKVRLCGINENGSININFE
jgi:threonylcarbamoyladenosine tRNA methylthiotransferase MtaB